MANSDECSSGSKIVDFSVTLTNPYWLAKRMLYRGIISTAQLTTLQGGGPKALSELPLAWRAIKSELACIPQAAGVSAQTVLKHVLKILKMNETK